MVFARRLQRLADVAACGARIGRLAGEAHVEKARGKRPGIDPGEEPAG
jgi:hypothetical protein